MHLKNLSRKRKGKGMTQEGLARKAGISFHTLVKIESGGIKNPKIDTVIRLAKALEITLEAIIN